MNLKFLNRIALLLVAMCFSSLSYTAVVWIDVRSLAEHTIDNIEGDVRISHGEIVQTVNEMFPDKTTEINLYCRSGGRAGKAMSALREAEYTNVSNMGGIDDAREERGMVIPPGSS